MDSPGAEIFVDYQDRPIDLKLHCRMVVKYEILLRLLYYTGIVLKKVVRNLV